MFRAKLFTVTSIAFGGYFAGLATERYFGPLSNNKAAECKCPLQDPTPGLFPKPGLPVFATVSAASLIPSKSSNEIKSIPPEPPANASRMSQVKHPAFLLKSIEIFYSH